MTREQVLQLRHGDVLHAGTCKAKHKVPSPGGGGRTYTVAAQVEQWRVMSKVKTWKRRPDAVQVGLKHGLWHYYTLTEWNMAGFHRAEDCPLKEEHDGADVQS